MARMDTTFASTLARIHSETAFEADSIAERPGRVDIMVRMHGPMVNADSDYRKFGAVANSVWRIDRFAAADTVAVLIERIVRDDSLIERNTYFYYRSERH